MTKEQAIKLYESGFYLDMTDKEIAIFQLFEDKLCMPFSIFHKAAEKALGRSVYTHEFGLNRTGLERELLGNQPAPTMQEIIEMIPEDKRVIVQIE